ncbi:MAG TPA: aminotransferase class III-fold pyridoxal phosphate-dependent enzyme [Kineosporiaceae bacterium]|nr:aminotransferase class III-fold pyridoxal phosphate-dependent enzyme [Kineosporiaceae bacterium]
MASVSDYPFFFTWTAQHAAKPLEITGGDRAHFTTADGGTWLDLGTLSYQVNAGHGRRPIVEAIKRQADELCLSAPNAVYPAKTELARRLLAMAGRGFEQGKVFFTLGGAEANENAIKMARLVTNRLKLVSRYRSYHGASMGALTLTGDWRRPAVEPGVPGVVHVQDCYCDRCPFGQKVETCKRECATNIGETMRLEGPQSVAAVFLEPVQNSGGCFPPPPGYFDRVREICDHYEVLLVSDETICAFGRIGGMFACEDLKYQPDMITCAKGMTSGYSPIGAMIASDRLFEPFRTGTTYFPHGYTFGGHPVSAAVAMTNLDIFEREGLYQHVREQAPAFRASLERLLDLPIVGDVRGEGFFYGIELVKDKATRETFDDDESERLLRGFLSKALFDAGLYCRADDRGDPVVQLAPPVIIGQPEFDQIEQILRSVLTEAWSRI